MEGRLEHEAMTGGTLTRAALVERVVDVADLTKKRAEVIVETVFGSIAESLRRGEKVELRGFGSFASGREPHRAATRGPATGWTWPGQWVRWSHADFAVLTNQFSMDENPGCSVHVHTGCFHK